MLEQCALKMPEILLPGEKCDLTKWAVVACDQFTSQPDYWRRVQETVGGAPSALNLIYPEAWLGEGDARIARINDAMRDYERNVLARRFAGFVLVERAVSAGKRLGLIAAVDLEKYDFSRGSTSLIRPTEGTILERIPPRVRIREHAALELPHILLLADDPGRTLIEPLWARRDEFEKLYDFDLMESGGHIRGWRVGDEHALDGALSGLLEKANGLLFAVGDGNHSLAAARQCWLDIRRTLTPEQREDHPARYALVELVNLACPALVFEPIHRALFGVEPEALIAEYRAYLAENGADEGEGDDLVAFDGAGRQWRFRSAQHPLRLLQGFLDGYMARRPAARIDYIHGADALRGLVDRPDAMGFMPRAFAKEELFGYIRRFGALPRKTFSMGEATEKRYYMEARAIR